MTYKQGGYEAHMTFDKQHHVVITKWLDMGLPEFEGFVYSVITGCPLLGQGTYCYLTSYSKDAPDTLVTKMERAAAFLQAADGIQTLRSKVEHIVYDSKTGVNELAERENG